jgi:hypothetical protein
MQFLTCHTTLVQVLVHPHYPHGRSITDRHLSNTVQLIDLWWVNSPNSVNHGHTDQWALHHVEPSAVDGGIVRSVNHHDAPQLGINTASPLSRNRESRERQTHRLRHGSVHKSPAVSRLSNAWFAMALKKAYI